MIVVVVVVAAKSLGGAVESIGDRHCHSGEPRRCAVESSESVIAASAAILAAVRAGRVGNARTGSGDGLRQIDDGRGIHRDEDRLDRRRGSQEHPGGDVFRLHAALRRSCKSVASSLSDKLDCELILGDACAARLRPGPRFRCRQRSSPVATRRRDRFRPPDR